MTSQASAPAPSWSPADTVRVGVIGTGAMGRDHVETFRRWVPAATVAAVYDRATEVAERTAAAAVDATVASSPQGLIDDPGIDAVVVCSPDATHRELVLACVEAGKPVLCEKPLADTCDGTAEVMRAEVARGRRLVQVGFMRRYDPAYRQLRARIRDGGQGEPVMLHCAHRNAANATAATPDMVVTNSMVHELDVARWLLDEEVREVTTRPVRRGGSWRPGDPVIAWLEMTSGVTVEVEVFVNAGYGYDIRCEVVGAHGTSSLPERVVPDFQTRFADAYRIELGAWVASVQAGRAEGPSSWDGHRASVAAAACVESLLRGTPVAVPVEERPALYAPASPSMGAETAP